MNLLGQVAIVTGGAQGMGRAIAQRLAREGATVVIADIQADRAERAAQEIKAEGHKCISVVTDVSDGRQVANLVERALKLEDRIDILVNNVGWCELRPFVTDDEPYWDKVIAINYKGAVLCCRAVLDSMIKAKRGKIVNMSSDAGRVGQSGEAVYSGTKAAIIGFSKALAREVARHGVNVNVVCPGPTETPLEASQDQEVIGRIVRLIPFRRMAKPEEIAEAVLFFASTSSDYITGQVLSVSGGLTMVG